MTYRVTQKVLFRHCDPAGIVFYPRYLEMVNDAVESFFDEIVGLPFKAMHETHGVPTVRLEAHFESPSRQGDNLEISLTPIRLGKSSVDLEIVATCHGATRFSISVTLVWINAAMQSEPWPVAIRNAFESQMRTTVRGISVG